MRFDYFLMRNYRNLNDENPQCGQHDTAVLRKKTPKPLKMMHLFTVADYIVPDAGGQIWVCAFQHSLTCAHFPSSRADGNTTPRLAV
jgi:hypothetical protein